MSDNISKLLKESRDFFRSGETIENLRHGVMLELGSPETIVTEACTNALYALRKWCVKTCFVRGFLPTDMKLMAESFDHGAEIGAMLAIRVEHTGTWTAARFVVYLVNLIENLQAQIGYKDKEIQKLNGNCVELHGDIQRILSDDCTPGEREKIKRKYWYLFQNNLEEAE